MDGGSKLSTTEAVSFDGEVRKSPSVVQRASKQGGVRVLNHRRIILRNTLLAMAPGLIATAVLLGLGDFPARVIYTVVAVLVVTGSFFFVALIESVFRPIQAASNMLSALREGDFSLKPRAVDPEDPFGQLMLEIDALIDVLRTERMGAVEANLLLHRVMESIDVAVFTFDPQQRLNLVNPAAAQLLGASEPGTFEGRPLSELPEGLSKCLNGEEVSEIQFPGRAGRWGYRTGVFYEDGEPQTLLLVTDLSRALREEERLAWKRLIRVLGHEINNSLAPIGSICGTLQKVLRQDPPPEDWREDFEDGLSVIEKRMKSLGQFVQDYSRIARLPPPRKTRFSFAELAKRVSSLHEDQVQQLTIEAGTPTELSADENQMEQVLINLLKNATEASRQAGGSKVVLRWRVSGSSLVIDILDDGPGIANPDNLFVPFFSTKPEGSGIGLTLCRQIVEQHQGQISLKNRSDGVTGAIGTINLPLNDSQSES